MTIESFHLAKGPQYRHVEEQYIPNPVYPNSGSRNRKGRRISPLAEGLAVLIPKIGENMKEEEERSECTCDLQIHS